MSSAIAETLLAYTQRNVSFEVQKAVAITVMTTAMSLWNSSVLDAANLAAACCGYNPEVVRRWASAFTCSSSRCSLESLSDENITEMLSSKRGHHESHFASLLHDESFCLAARTYVRTHACKKGEPNLTCRMFVDWVKTEYDVIIHEETARRWLVELGFSRVHHQKGVYFDGHDRDDVVTYRNEFLK